MGYNYYFADTESISFFVAFKLKKCILVNDVKQNIIKLNSTKKLNKKLVNNSIKIYDKSRANENERSTPLIFHTIFK